MFLSSSEADQPGLNRFLGDLEPYSTFIVADIEAHGFSAPFQAVHHHLDASGNVDAVVLRFFEILLVATSPAFDSFDEIAELVGPQIDRLMGHPRDVQGILTELSARGTEPERLELQTFWVLADPAQLSPPSDTTITLGLEDVDDAHEFLMSIPSFKRIYGDKDMIAERLKTGSGTHLARRSGGRIVAHVNTAAKTERYTMIGGLAVDPNFRGRGLATQILSDVSRLTLAAGATPCLFSTHTGEDSLFSNIGMHRIGQWASAFLRSQ